ncbi:MAG: hypothetical protein ACRD1L_00390 [Terriglobales bacterium]
MWFEPHPDANLLSACWEGRLRPAERLHVLHHLSECEVCRQIAAQARLACNQCGGEALPAPAIRRVGWSSGAWVAAATLASAAALAFGVWLLPLHSARLATAPAPPAPPIAASPTIVKLQPWAPVPPPARLRARAPRALAPPRPPSVAATAVASTRLPSFPQVPLPAATSEIEPAIDFSPLMTGFQDQPPLAAVAGQASAELASWTGAAPVLPRRTAEAAPAELTPAVGPLPVWPFAEGFAAGATSAAPSGPLSPTLPVAGLGWAISRGGQVLHSIGAGVWAAVPLVPGVRIRALFNSQATIWAGGRADQLYLSSDSGSHWRQVQLPGVSSHPPQLTKISFADSGHGLVTASDGASWSTADGGRSWTRR